MSIAEKLIEEFEKDIRLVLINAVIAEVATKRDINELRNEFRNEINQLRSEIHSNFKWTIGVIITVWGTTIIPLLLKLSGMI